MTSWMREEPTGPSTEDYLLGKAVDKNFDQQGTMGQINAVEYDCTPESIFSSRAEHQVDLQRKLQEDPLVAIKKKELDTRKKVLDNPIKMREIKGYLENTRKRKKKKSKKKKRSSDDEEDLDRLLLQKLEKFNPKESSSKDRRQDSSSDDSSEDNKRKKKNSDKRRRRSRSPVGHRRGERGRSRSPYTSRHHHGTRDEGKKRVDGKDREAERERKLREMTENAKWREDQRQKNVRRYRDEDNREDTELRTRDHDPEFIRKQLRDAATAGTVEKRIQANRHNIQRGHAVMDSNFARR